MAAGIYDWAINELEAVRQIVIENMGVNPESAQNATRREKLQSIEAAIKKLMEG